MVNSSCGTEPHLNKFKEHQPEREAVQVKESDKEVSINVAEQEAVSAPVVILSDVIQDNAVSDRLGSTELALEPANLHQIDPALSEVFYEVNQANVTTTETEEQHSTDFKNEPQDQPDLEGPVIKLLGEFDEVENGTKTTSSLEPQTSHKDQSSPNPSLEHSLDVNGDGMLFQEIEEIKIVPKARDDRPGRLSGIVPEHLEETCFHSEIQLQVTEEVEILEPPTKKRLKRRMGMCGLRDRKRKLPFDGHQCQQGLVGRPKEEGISKGNKGVQHLYSTMLENDITTPMDHEEGTTRAACKKKEEVLKDKQNNDAAVMDAERTGVAEKENRYALGNMNKCTELMNDKITTDELHTDNRDVLNKGILEEENDSTVIVDDQGTAKQMVLEHELNLLEDVTEEVGQTLGSPTIGKNTNMIQDEPLVAASTSDHEMETATCGDEPNFPGTEMTNNKQDIEFNVKHDILSEKQNLHADNKVDEDPDEIATKVEVAQEVTCSSICAAVEISEGSFLVTKEVQEVPAGLEESEIETEEQCPSKMAPTEEPESDGPELSESIEKGLDPFFFENISIAEIASIEIHNAKGHSENDVPIPAVSEGTEPADNTKAISEPMGPSTDQENHMHVSGTVALSKTPICNTYI